MGNKESGNSILKAIFGEHKRELNLLLNKIFRLNNTSSDKHPQLSFLLPEKELQASEDEFDEDLNLFNIYPDPIHFVQLLKNLDRADISSDLFLKLLENYRDMKGRPGDDSMAYVDLLSLIGPQIFIKFK